MNILPTMGVEASIYAQFTGASNGAQRATGEMIKQWVKEVRSGAHREEVPVVKFSADHYKHKQYGKVPVPSMEICRWVTPDEQPPVQTQPVSTEGSSASKDIPLE